MGIIPVDFSKYFAKVFGKKKRVITFAAPKGKIRSGLGDGIRV